MILQGILDAKFPQCGGSIRVWIGVIAAIPATTVPGTTGILAAEITTEVLQLSTAATTSPTLTANVHMFGCRT